MSGTDCREKAKEYFETGLNCAQSVAMALSEKSGVPTSVIKAVAAPFGGGVARSRQLCGAVSGMLMTIGAAHPDYSKTEIYEISRKAMNDFYEKFGTLNCAELLKDAGADDSPVPSERTPEYYASRPCEKIIGCAVEIAEKYL